MDRIITFPRIGKYSNIFRDMLVEMGLNIQLPPPITENTVKEGCKHSAEMVCYPFKISLGSLKEALDNGANTLLMFDTKGTCRFRHYWILQEAILREQGYEFEMYSVNTTNIYRVFKKLSVKTSYFRIFKTIIKYWKKIKEMDKQEFKEGINIGIIGEVFTCIDQKVNLDLVNKLKKLGVNVYETVTMYEFLKGYWEYKWHINLSKRGYKKEASKFLNGKIGGHGYENIYNLLWLIDKKIDGVVHLLPLSCLTKNTKITMEGYIPKSIEDVKIGEKVLTHKGRFRKVINTMSRQYNGKILEINCGGELKFNITPEHSVLLLKRKNIACVNPTKGLSITCRPYKDSNNCYFNGAKCYKKEKMSFKPEFLPIKQARKGDFIAIPKQKGIIKKLNEERLILPKRRMSSVLFIEIKNYFLVPIKCITKEKFKGKVYNLEIEEDNSYIANCLSVHNCMPDVMIEPIIDSICKKNDIPLLRIPIDENNSETNLANRLEAFVEMIKMRGSIKQ